MMSHDIPWYPMISHVFMTFEDILSPNKFLGHSITSTPSAPPDSLRLPERVAHPPHSYEGLGSLVISWWFTKWWVLPWVYRTYPLEMEVLYGFMGKSWEYMGIPSGKHTKSYQKWWFYPAKIFMLVGGAISPSWKMMESVGKDDIPYMTWKKQFMFETTNQ